MSEDLIKLTQELRSSCHSNDRGNIGKSVFRVECHVGTAGAFSPTVFEAVIELLNHLDPHTSAAYVALVNLLQQQWSSLTELQRAKTIDVLKPKAEIMEFFEAQQAILEILDGKHLG